MIIFTGLAGSGKSTQGQLLAARLHCPWISTGNLLREFNTDTKIQQRMLRGEVIDDDTALEVVNAELKRVDAAHNECVLDGSPRTIQQAQWLAKKAQKGEFKITAIIHLKTSQEVAKQRLLARQRPDDHEAAIAERFAEFEKVIKPVLDYFREQGFKVYDIDGEASPEATANAIAQKLELGN